MISVPPPPALASRVFTAVVIGDTGDSQPLLEVPGENNGDLS